MQFRWMVLALAIGLWWSAQAWTEQPVSVQDKMLKALRSQPEKILQLAAELQSDPYGPHAMAIVSVLTQYGITSSHITLTLGSLIQPWSATRRKDVDERLFGAYWTGLLVYAFEHNGHAGADDASNTLAVQYTLTTYRNMLKARPAERDAYADKLMALSRNGTLMAFVHEQGAIDNSHKAASPTPSPAASSPSPAASGPSPQASGSPSAGASPELPGQGQPPPPTATVPKGLSTGQL